VPGVSWAANDMASSLWRPHPYAQQGEGRGSGAADEDLVVVLF